MCYLTCGLVDDGVPDYSLESAICKVSGTEFLWYAANRVLQLAGGEGYMRDRSLREGPPGHPHLSDLRGRERRAACLHRARRVQAGRREARGPLGDRAERPDPLDRRAGRIRERPDPARGPPGQAQHGPRGALRPRRQRLRPGEATAPGSPRNCCGTTRRRSSSASSSRSGSRTASPTSTRRSRVLSRVSQIFEDQGVEPSGQERYIADTFCTRAAAPGRGPLRPDRVERRRADDGDRQARLQARLLRLRALRGLSSTSSACASARRPCGPGTARRSSGRRWSSAPR